MFFYFQCIFRSPKELLKSVIDLIACCISEDITTQIYPKWTDHLSNSSVLHVFCFPSWDPGCGGEDTHTVQAFIRPAQRRCLDVGQDDKEPDWNRGDVGSREHGKGEREGRQSMV